MGGGSGKHDQPSAGRRQGPLQTTTAGTGRRHPFAMPADCVRAVGTGGRAEGRVMKLGWVSVALCKALRAWLAGTVRWILSTRQYWRSRSTRPSIQFCVLPRVETSLATWKGPKF